MGEHLTRAPCGGCESWPSEGVLPRWGRKPGAGPCGRAWGHWVRTVRGEPLHILFLCAGIFCRIQQRQGFLSSFLNEDTDIWREI